MARYPNTRERPGGDSREELVADAESALSRLAVLFERLLESDSSGAGAALGFESGALASSAWRRPALSDSVLQEVRFGAPRSASAAAFRVIQGKVEAFGESGLLVSARSRLSFNTYLNSFYETYWSRHAPLDVITLRIFGVGSVTVEVFRSMPDGTLYRVARAPIDLDSEPGGMIDVPLDASHARSGRLHFTVEAAKSQVTILAARFETKARPLRPVRLGIGPVHIQPRIDACREPAADRPVSLLPLGLPTDRDRQPRHALRLGGDADAAFGTWRQYPRRRTR